MTVASTRSRLGAVSGITITLTGLGAASAPLSAGDDVVRATGDGTLVDGGPFGVFDGFADIADWSFNESSFEGAVTFSRSPVGMEHRVVGEYDLRNIQAEPPVEAFLSFTLRGAAIFPADPAWVRIAAYDADLLERLTDFNQEAIDVIARLQIKPFQPQTAYTINVSIPVTAALTAGKPGIGIRFEIDPAMQEDFGQAFMDILDMEPMTKPSIRVIDRFPGDFDGDLDVDQQDVAAMGACVSGPNHVVVGGCDVLDFDADGDVDLGDHQFMVRIFNELGPTQVARFGTVSASNSRTGPR